MNKENRRIMTNWIYNFIHLVDSLSAFSILYTNNESAVVVVVVTQNKTSFWIETIGWSKKSLWLNFNDIVEFPYYYFLIPCLWQLFLLKVAITQLQKKTNLINWLNCTKLFTSIAIFSTINYKYDSNWNCYSSRSHSMWQPQLFRIENIIITFM